MNGWNQGHEICLALYSGTIFNVHVTVPPSKQGILKPVCMTYDGVCPKPPTTVLTSVILHGVSSGCGWKRRYYEHTEYAVVNSQQEAVLLFGLEGGTNSSSL
jgi:hypothetical protein